MLSGEHELRDALAEIAEDTKRASEIVHRVRELVRKGEPTVISLDIHTVIGDVTRLLASDAILRT
jgi:two-component system sensor kinase FixL